MEAKAGREMMSSRIGFLLVSAGCAIGLGNVWKFPYIVGQNGGGAFVLIYLFFLVILGIPILTMEFSIGRGSRRSPIDMFTPLEPEGTKWHLRGYVATAGCFLLMMFYAVVAGWMIYYFVKTATGSMSGLDHAGILRTFTDLTGDWQLMVLCTLVIVLAGFAICSLGLRNGLEKITKFMMLDMLVVMVILAIHSCTLEGAGEGLDFYLRPDLESIKNIGIWDVCVTAMSQAFFTLGIGIGSMAIFGSYVDRKNTLMGEAAYVAVLDTVVAVMAGLIIFPACFTYDVAVNSGPMLIFVTLPNVFNALPGGQIWGALFFLFMCFASFSTCLTLFEAQIASFMDKLGISRRKACATVCPIMFLLTLPCIFGFSVWTDFQPLGAGTSVQDLEDFVLSYVMLPVGALAFSVFCTTRYGWGWKNFTEEANAGSGIKVRKWMRPYMTYVLPVIILVLFVTGVIDHI